MPVGAVVIPKIEMHVHDTGTFVVGCVPCNYFPDQFYNETAARQDAYRHNAEKHDGAGVELTSAMPVEFARLDEKHARSMFRMSKVFALLYILMVVALIFVLTHDLLTTGLLFFWTVILTANAYRWGEAQTRVEVAIAESQRIQRLFNPPQEDDE